MSKKIYKGLVSDKSYKTNKKKYENLIKYEKQTILNIKKI